MTCNNPESHFNRATDLFGQGRLNDAMEELREALRLRPNWIEALEVLDELAIKHKMMGN